MLSTILLRSKVSQGAMKWCGVPLEADSPFNTLHVNAEVYSQEPLVFRQAYLQELVIPQLLHRLVLQVFEGIGIVSLIYILPF